MHLDHIGLGGFLVALAGREHLVLQPAVEGGDAVTFAVVGEVRGSGRGIRLGFTGQALGNFLLHLLLESDHGLADLGLGHLRFTVPKPVGQAAGEVFHGDHDPLLFHGHAGLETEGIADLGRLGFRCRGCLRFLGAGVTGQEDKRQCEGEPG